jgi:hypothetical protein
MPWQPDIERLDGGRIHRVTFMDGGETLAYSRAIEGWRSDGTFRTRFIRVLADAPFDAFFWETPPVTRETIERPFEFVMVDSPALAAMAPDRNAFAEHFAKGHAQDGVSCFWNLGHDAYLVAPDLPAPPKSHAHLAAFARAAPPGLQDALWRAVGEAVAAQLSDRPLWLSTSGLGIAWLHVRLDAFPKYYTYAPYRQTG